LGKAGLACMRSGRVMRCRGELVVLLKQAVPLGAHTEGAWPLERPLQRMTASVRLRAQHFRMIC